MWPLWPVRSLRGLAGLTLAAAAALAALAYAASRPYAASPDAIWAQAEAELKQDRFDRVEAAIARLARLRAPTPADWMLRGQLAVALKQPDLALDDLGKIPDDSPMAATARLLAGQVELRRNRFRRAETAFLAAIRLDPSLIPAHRELIFIYGFQLRRDALGREFTALSNLTDLRFEELFHWALLRNESWEPAETAQVLARCVEADPLDRWSRLALAENERRLGQLDKARSTLAPLAESDPEAIAARVRIALEQNDSATVERLLASGPRDDPALARLRGRMALSRNDAAEAVRQFRIAYQAEPDSRETVTGLIAALGITGDTRSAEPLREAAARLDQMRALVQRAAAKRGGDDPELPLLLGDACAALHRDVEARGWYQVAIARNPLDSRAQRALYHLSQSAGQVQNPPKRPPRPAPGSGDDGNTF